MARPGNGKDRTGKAPPARFAGTPADRLVRFWRTNDQRFDDLLDEVLDAGRQAVVEAAAGKLREEEVPDFLDEVEAIAETTSRTDAYGDTTIATLFWLSAEVEGDLTQPPPADVIERALDSTGLLEAVSDTRLLPAWLDPEALLYLEAADRRALLKRLLASVDEALRYVREEELVAVPQAAGPRRVAILGLIEEDAAALEADTGADPVGDPLRFGAGADEEPEIDPEEEERVGRAMAAFTGIVREADPRVLWCEPSGGLNDLLDRMAEDGPEDGGVLDELAAFIEVAGDEASDAVVQAEVRAVPGGLMVRAFGSDGRLLDERSFALAGEQVEPAIALLRRRCHGVTVAS